MQIACNKIKLLCAQPYIQALSLLTILITSIFRNMSRHSSNVVSTFRIVMSLTTHFKQTPVNVADRSQSIPSHLREIKKNLLLASLPDTALENWFPDLEFIEMPLGLVLYESGEIEKYVYFPTSAIVSILYVMENGDSAEIAVVGNEGVVGISLFMGGNSTPGRALVQSAGSGFRLNAKAMQDQFAEFGPVTHLLLRYTQALISQMAQTAVCNRHHSLDKQLCRWLLLSLDRLQGNELVMTQELIANMLGVRREGVTEAAAKLQRAGLISYTRGRIEVLNRKRLEKRSCECYAVVKAEYDRLLPLKIVT